MSEVVKNTEEIILSVENRAGVITLNRPAALNALSINMIQMMYKQLMLWQSDAAIDWVLVQSSLSKAFCAGGDIRALHAMAGDLTAGQAYFAQEYCLNHLTHHYAKPYVAVMDGIVMGGGMGISQGSALRIVTEATRLAMPETAIGLIPDVGGSYFLARTHKNAAIGRYLATTGAIISGVDACRWRLADVMVEQSQLPELIEALKSNSAKDLASLREIASDFAMPLSYSKYPNVSEFEPHIIEVFDEAHNLVQIESHLEGLVQKNISEKVTEWAKNTLTQLNYNSPVAIHLALHNQEIGRTATLGECLRLEFDSISNLLVLGEATEGIRAKLVDKDNAPKWHAHDVERALLQVKQPLFSVEVHPLAHLT